MIYFDNSATTYPKPKSVYKAAANAIFRYGGNPGRSGHKLSADSGEAIFSSREKLAHLFNADEENCIFTLNCTEALNIAIKGIAKLGGHFVISDLEHNSVARPVHSLMNKQICEYTVAETFYEDDLTYESFRASIQKNTVAVVMTACSNVTGQLLPFEHIAKVCEKRGICFILDVAQAAGNVSIKIGNGINIICGAGHKGLYGLMGTGFMVTDGKYALNPFSEGGTGSLSSDLNTPDFLPDRFEAGTPNVPGIVSLGAGIDFVEKVGIEKIYNHEVKLKKRFISNLEKYKDIKMYYSENSGTLVSFNIDGTDSQSFSAILNKNNFALRGGLHCSYLAHKKLGTLNTGTVRFSPSYFNNTDQVDYICKTIIKIKNNL